MEGQDVAQPELSEAQAVEQIASILGGKKAPQTEQPEPQPEAAEEVVQEASTTEDAPEQDENTITIDPEAPLFDVTVKVEGGSNENLKVSLKELEAGFMMQKDYQRKTAELARAREQLTQEVQKMVEPERQSFVQNLQTLQQAVLSLAAPELQNVNWEQLASDDPARYVQMTAKAQRVQQTLQHIQGQMQQAQQKAFQEAAEHSRKMLADPVAGIPNWGQEVYQSLITDASKSYGFSPEEVAQVVDYRMIKVLHDAHQYQKLKAAKPTVEKKVTAVPKVLKPGAPADSSALQAKREKELFSKLQKSGDIKDGAAVLLARMQRKR